MQEVFNITNLIRLLCLATLITTVHPGSVLAEVDSARSLILKAADNRGARVIHSGEIPFQAVIKMPPPTEARIKQAVDRQKSALIDQIDRLASQPEIRKLYEDALNHNKSVVTQQVIANANREILGIFRLLGPELGGDRVGEIRLRRGGASDWETE